jgi:hypothetical protein
MHTNSTQPQFPHRVQIQLAALQRARAGEGIHTLLSCVTRAMLPFRSEKQVSSALLRAVYNGGRAVWRGETSE